MRVSGRVSSVIHDPSVFVSYSNWHHEVFQTRSSKSKSPTPCLYCYSRERRRAFYQSVSSPSVASWKKYRSECLLREREKDEESLMAPMASV